MLKEYIKLRSICATGYLCRRVVRQRFFAKNYLREVVRCNPTQALVRLHAESSIYSSALCSLLRPCWDRNWSWRRTRLSWLDQGPAFQFLSIADGPKNTTSTIRPFNFN